MKRLARMIGGWCAAAVLMLAAGCTLTPQAIPEQDAYAKEFRAYPDAATIYVYRSEFNQLDYDSVLYVNGRLIGATLPGSYFRFDTTPGRHVVHGAGVDIGSIAIDARAGQVYFVALNVIGGHSNFRMVADEVGRERVRTCCVLREQRWAFQGPLYR